MDPQACLERIAELFEDELHQVPTDGLRKASTQVSPIHNGGATAPRFSAHQQEAKTMEYNGWKNYETWLVNTWLTNEESSYNHWVGMAQQLLEIWADDEPQATSDMADAIEEHLDTMHESKPCGLERDMLKAACDSVECRDIAQHFIDEAKEIAAA